MRLPWRRRETGEDRTSESRAGRRAGRRLGALVALVVAVGVVVAIVLGTESSPSSGSSGNANSSSGATAVETRNLTETDTESGTLSYANSYTVYNRLSGTITWLPAVGQVIRPGQALYRVENAPVTLMDGNTPAYRDLDSSDSDGPDILELNRNLVKLGFDAGGIVVDDVWQAATTEGVDLFQESLGETRDRRSHARAGRVPARQPARLERLRDRGLGRRRLGRLVRSARRRHAARVRQPDQVEQPGHERLGHGQPRLEHDAVLDDSAQAVQAEVEVQVGVEVRQEVVQPVD